MQRLIAGVVFVSIYEFQASGVTWVWAVRPRDARAALAFLEGRSDSPVLGHYLPVGEWRALAH